MKFATTFLHSLCALVCCATLFQAQSLQAQSLQAQPVKAQPLKAQPTETLAPTQYATATATPQITVVPLAPHSADAANENAPKFPDATSLDASSPDSIREDRVLDVAPRDVAPRDVAPRDIGEEWLRFDTSLKSIVSRMGLKLPLPQARVVVLKAQRRLELWSGKKLVKVYSVALGANPWGAKQKQHDSRTPEGHFYICTRNNRNSAFHVFLGLSYPALPDAQRGAKSGLINAREYQMIRNRLASRGAPLWETRLGGWVGIHGGTGNVYAKKQTAKRGRADWTAGCIAVTDREIEEIHSATVLGTPVWVRP